MMRALLATGVLVCVLCDMHAQTCLPCSMEEVNRVWRETFDESEATLARYAVADIDGDGVPEVFLSNYDGEEYQGNGDCKAVYVCHENKLSLLEQTYGMTAGSSEYDITFDSKKGCLYYSHSNRGDYEEYVYFLKNSKPTKCLAKEVTITWVEEDGEMKDTYKEHYYIYPIGTNGRIEYETRRETSKSKVEPYLPKFNYDNSDNDTDKLIWNYIKK